MTPNARVCAYPDRCVQTGQAQVAEARGVRACVAAYLLQWYLLQWPATWTHKKCARAPARRCVYTLYCQSVLVARRLNWTSNLGIYSSQISGTHSKGFPVTCSHSPTPSPAPCSCTASSSRPPAEFSESACGGFSAPASASCCTRWHSLARVWASG
jgi:hypothetical protein